ncbi:uncharacterized protein VK521_000881 isoform 1-T1 [Ammospiza maritima maritima]
MSNKRTWPAVFRGAGAGSPLAAGAPGLRTRTRRAAMDAARRWPQSGAHPPPPRRESCPPGAGPQRAPRPERDPEFPLRHRSGDRGLCQPAAQIGCVAATARAKLLGCVGSKRREHFVIFVGGRHKPPRPHSLHLEPSMVICSSTGKYEALRDRSQCLNLTSLQH